MSEYSPPNWTEPLSIYNPINFQQTAQTTNGGGGGGSGFLKYPVAQGPQTMKNTLVQGSFQVSASQSINMGANIVQNAGTPVNPTDLATKAYVDLNAGTQNLQSVLTAGNTTGNIHISHADNYGDIYNGNGAESWVVAVDPIQFSSTATNDLYLASSATDNFVRFGNYSGSVFTENARIGDLATGEKRAIFAGTLNSLCIEDNAPAPSKGTSGQFLSCGTGGSLLWASASGGAGTLDATLALGNTATGTYANITLTDTDTGGQANPMLTLVNTAATGSVAMEAYKNKPTAVVAGDVLFNQSVYGRDSTLTKQEYTRISHTIRDGTGGSEDGSIEFSCFVGGSVANFIQINGVENEVNFNKNIDMVGNNITCSTGSMTITTASSAGLGNLSATAKAGIALTASNGSVATTATTGISSTTSTGNVALTATAGNVNITSSAAGSNVMGGGITAIQGVGCVFSTGTTTGIQTGQAGGVARSILRTGYTNAYSQVLDYYPTEVVENTGLTTNIALPYMAKQNLIIVNSGISPTYTWTDVGSALVSSPTAFLRASSGLYWVGVYNGPAVQGYIYVYAGNTFTSPPLFIYDLGAGEAKIFYESNGFMFVGGQFAGIIGQPQAQFGIMRFAGSGTATPVFDPIYNSSTTQEGVSGNVNAITIDAGSGTMYFGGLFNSTFPSPYALENLCIMTNCFGSSGSQTFNNDLAGVPTPVANFAANGEIYCMEYYGGNVYYGGNFTQVASGFQLINYAAFYTPNWATIPQSSNGTIGQGNFNDPVYSFQMSVDGSGKLMFVGQFNFTENSQLIKYGGYIDTATPFDPCLPFGIATIGISSNLNCMNRNGTLNMFITDANEVWYGTDVNSWEDGGVAETTTFGPRGILYDSGALYAIIDQYLSVRLGSPSTASATFVLPSEAFKTSAGSFSKATLPEYASQHFVADVGGTYYHAVGTPICSFSN
jgi:hypothetical protein